MANLNKRMSAASGFIQPKTSSSKLVTAMAYSNSNDGMVRVVYDGEDSAIYAASLGTDGYADIPTIASIEASEENPKSVNVLIQDGVATAIGYAGWGDSVQEQVSANTSKTQHMEFIESGTDAGLHIFDGTTRSQGSDLHLQSDAIKFVIDGEDASSRTIGVDEYGHFILESNTRGFTFETDMSGQQSPGEVDNHPKAFFSNRSGYSANSWKVPRAWLLVSDDTAYDNLDDNGLAYIELNGASYTSYDSSTSYRMSDPAYIYIQSMGLYGELSDWVKKSGTASTVRMARTTAYAAVDATGWSYEVYASGKFHASAVVKWRAAMTSSHQGMYRTASDIYIPLPCQATRLTNVTFGQAMGGSSAGEVFCHAAGGISTWDGSATSVQVAFRGFTAASTAIPSGDAWYYSPIDVWGVTE